MAHSDDDGLVIPPRLAPLHVVIVPIFKNAEQLAAITEKADAIIKELKALNIIVKFDDSDTAKPGWKFAEYELKGVPVRIAMGMRDVENNTVEIARRDTKEKSTVTNENLGVYIQELLEKIQQNMYDKALAFRTANTFVLDTWDDFTAQIEKGGFIYAHWDGTSETEDKIKELTKATIRCIPMDAVQEAGTCIYSGNPSTQRVLFARAY